LSEGPDAAPSDFVGLVLGALAFGVALGVGIQGLVTWTVRTLQQGAPTQAAPALTSTPALVLLLGTLAGIVAAGLASWRLLAPIHNPWRQAMLALIAGMGSFAVSLVTLPIDRALGRPGLLGLAAVAALVCGLIGRRLSSRRQSA
jgi:hypothetical protein